jgi:hypothetical protein
MRRYIIGAAAALIMTAGVGAMAVRAPRVPGVGGKATSNVDMNGKTISDSTGDVQLDDDLDVSGDIHLSPGEALNFGPETSSYAQLYATATQIQVRRGDDSTFAGLDLGLTRIYDALNAYGTQFFISAESGYGSNGFHLVTHSAYDQTTLSSHADSGNQLLLVPDAYRSSDFDVAAPTDPTLCVFSAVDPDTDNADKICLSHDQTNAVLEVGSGSLDVSSADTLIAPQQISAAPTEPVTCDATTEGAFQYVDDTDDTAYGRVCICANLDGTGYDWRDMGDIVGTACPFY